MNIPKIGMGTWSMGGKYEKDRSNYQKSIDVLKAGLELGFKLIDTAELYGRGLCEEIVGEAIKDFKREDIFIISKVWQDNLKYEAVIKAARGSLKRLGTDYLDLYLIHWSKENQPKKVVPLAETMAAMEFLVRQRIIRYLGVSNADVHLLKKAQSYLKKTKITANQIEYNLIEREVETEIIPYCRQQQIKIIAYRPLTRGNINWAKHPIMIKLAKKYKKTPVQIALNWIMSKNIVPIPRTINVEHLVENYGAAGWELEANDVELINNINY